MQAIQWRTQGENWGTTVNFFTVEYSASASASHHFALLPMWLWWDGQAIWQKLYKNILDVVHDLDCLELLG